MAGKTPGIPAPEGSLELPKPPRRQGMSEIIKHAPGCAGATSVPMETSLVPESPAPVSHLPDSPGMHLCSCLQAPWVGNRAQRGL